MKNKLSDLNNHLFAQLERLSDESLQGDKLKEEIERSKSISGIAKDITQNARLALDASRFKADVMAGKAEVPDFLGIGNES